MLAGDLDKSTCACLHHPPLIETLRYWKVMPKRIQNRGMSSKSDPHVARDRLASSLDADRSAEGEKREEGGCGDSRPLTFWKSVFWRHAHGPQAETFSGSDSRARWADTVSQAGGREAELNRTLHLAPTSSANKRKQRKTGGLCSPALLTMEAE